MRMTRSWLLPCWILTVMIARLAYAGPVQAQDAYFPELVFLPLDKDVNSIIDDMTSVHLRAMNEPSLWKLSRQKRTANVYRFLWLQPLGQHPICIRLTQAGEDYGLHVGSHDGASGITAGRLTLNKDLKLNKQLGDKLIELIGKSRFWTTPVMVKEDGAIADGDVIVIEGVKDGRYHVIDRGGTSSGESLKAFCRELLRLADEPVMLRAWDRSRQIERMSPSYRPEPPQTEDRGAPYAGTDAP